MTTTNQDPWIYEDDADETQTATPPAQSAPTKPDVAADPAIPTLVLPKPQTESVLADKSVSAAVKEALAKADEPLPKGSSKEARDLLHLINQLLKSDKISRRDCAALIAKKKPLIDHINSVEQLPKALEIDPQKTGIERAKHLGAAHARRVSDAARITAALASDSPSYVINKSPLNGIDAFMELDTTRAAINELYPRLLKHKLTCIENHLWLAPNSRAAEHKLVLASHPTDEQLQTILDEAATLSGKHFASIQSIKVSQIVKFYDEEIKPRIGALLASAEKFIQGERNHATEVEREFFESFGLKHERTSVSRQYDHTLREIEHRLKIHNNPTPAVVVVSPSAAAIRITDADSTALTQLLGVQLLPNT